MKVRRHWGEALSGFEEFSPLSGLSLRARQMAS